MDPVDAIQHKYLRAVRHIEEWNAALDQWLTDREPLTIRGTADSETGWFEVTLVVREEMPAALYLIFADYISNLRATLDHIVWFLTTTNGRDPGDRNIYFPCVADSKTWPTTVESQLRNFPPEGLPTIKEAQPFQYGPAYRQHPMYVLHHLDIRTKHRLLVPFAVVAFHLTPTFELNRPAKEGEGYESVFWPLQEFVDGARIMAYRMASVDDDLRITRIVTDVPMGIGLGPVSDVTQMDGHLPNLTVFVGSVLEDLRPVLRREV